MRSVDDAVLDDLLERDRPVLAPRTAELVAVLAEIAAEPRRRRKKWRIGAVVSLGVVLASGATAAIASPSVREWLGWTPDWTVTYESTTGESCAASFLIDYQQYRNGQSRSGAEVYALAVDVTEALDLSPRGILRAVGERRDDMQSAGEEWGDPWLALPPAEFESFAVQQLMVDALHEAFAANNVFTDEIRVNIECDKAPR